MQGFITFIREQGIIGFAIGFILGGAVSKVVSSLVSDILNPMIALIFGNVASLQNMQWEFGEVAFRYGSFLSNLLDFLILSAVVYFVFKGFGFDKLDKKKD